MWRNSGTTWKACNNSNNPPTGKDLKASGRRRVACKDVARKRWWGTVEMKCISSYHTDIEEKKTKIVGREGRLPVVKGSEESFLI